MNDQESRLEREVQELRAEVRRLRRLLEGVCILIGLAVVILFPQLALVIGSLAVLILFAFLVSPVRGLIFSSIFHRQSDK